MNRVLYCFALMALCSSAIAAEGWMLKENGVSVHYHLIAPSARSAKSEIGGGDWIPARKKDGKHQFNFGPSIVVQVKSTNGLSEALAKQGIQLDRSLGRNTFIARARSSAVALQAARELSLDENVLTSIPIARRSPRLHSPYAFLPNDPLFPNQFYLENRDVTGGMRGADLNVRGAWPITRGGDVVVGVADDGIEITHPDLESRVTNVPHFNFITGVADGAPDSSYDMHATAVAGLIAATENNGLGVTGVAPEARLASWKIFADGQSPSFPTDEQMMDMFEHRTDIVAVQNHSWGYGGVVQDGPSLLEQIGISNAVTTGRTGLGVVMVRSAGNERATGGDANNDGYVSDPQVIAVAAVRADGRATRYSNAGACVLVAAPSSEIQEVGSGTDPAFPTLATTDRQGAEGYNPTGDYGLDSTGFSGTSGSAPQISGIAALILSAKPSLTFRDVQHIFIQASRHIDVADPNIRTNQAGFLVSHNVGFGVPDAAFAVQLAQRWTNRPPVSRVEFSVTNAVLIPDDGLRLELADANAPVGIQSIGAMPGLGLHPDRPTGALPLVHVGAATEPISANLTGKGALIRRGTNFFREKIRFAADAGAAYAVIYNNTNDTERVLMGSTDFSPIPAVFISQRDGEALVDYLTQTNSAAGLRLESASYDLAVTNMLNCEHVAVRIALDHPRQTDVRITLTSPAGTCSVLHRLTGETNASAASGWTYYSTQNYYESSVGQWNVSITDERPGSTGAVRSVTLMLSGAAIFDTDSDGLDDDWERAHFGSLALNGKDDPDHDGYSNAREFILGSDPQRTNGALDLTLSRWNGELARLSWPGTVGRQYDIFSAESVTNGVWITNIVGKFPECEWYLPYRQGGQKFFRIRQRAEP